MHASVQGQPLERLPLRQSVQPAAEVFARQDLLDRLSRPDRFHFTTFGDGGQIHAASEAALAEAQALLRDAYGPQIAFGEPTIHTFVDRASEAVMHPVMRLRLQAARAHVLWLLEGLKLRHADVRSVELQRERVRIAAEAPLAALLGYERSVAALTDEATRVECEVLRYEPAAGTGARPAPGWHLGARAPAQGCTRSR